MSEPTFDEMLRAFTDETRGRAVPTDLLLALRRWYAAAHPPRATAESVLEEYLGESWAVISRRLAARLADAQNAERDEPEDDAWIERAAERCSNACRCIESVAYLSIIREEAGQRIADAQWTERNG